MKMEKWEVSPNRAYTTTLLLTSVSLHPSVWLLAGAHGTGEINAGSNLEM